MHTMGHPGASQWKGVSKDSEFGYVRSSGRRVRKRLVQVAKSCPILCAQGFTVLHYLPKFPQTHVHWVSDAIQTISSSAIPFSSCPQSFPASGSFPKIWLFASASASVLPVNIQGQFPLGWTGLTSLQSKGLSSLLQSHSSKASILWHWGLESVSKQG